MARDEAYQKAEQKIEEARRSGAAELYVYGMGLTELPKSVGQLTQLKQIYAHDNELTSLPSELGLLPKLVWLDFERNKLASLPKELISLPKQANICLSKNPALGLPTEVIGPPAPELYRKRHQSNKGNVRSILNYYFRISDPDGAAPLNEFKLILVGRGEVGKTTLVEKLVTDKFKKFEKTPGVKITQWPRKIGHDEVRAHVWDFGGQEILHGTHRFFMTERAVYLVLVSKRTGMEDHDADYWLSLIRSFAGNEVPVILLLHRWSEQRFELNREQLKQKYGPHLCFLETDCGEKPGQEKNIKKLRQWIAREAAKLPGLKAKWPKVWRSVKEDLPKEKKNWLTFADFETFCTAHRVPKEDHEALAQRLHDLGLMLAYRNEPVLRGFGVLNSMWVTDGIYKLINSSRLQDQKGRFKPADFKTVLPAKDYPAQLHPFLLALMQKFRLCFPLDEEGKQYLIPELLSKEEPKLDDAFPSETSLCFTYRYDRVLPEGLLPRFIVDTYVQREAENAWRTGVVLKLADCRALVRGDVQARKITVRVVGAESAGRRKLLAITREHFDQIHRSFTALPVTELVPVPGHPEVELDYLELVRFEADKVEKLPKLVAGKTLQLDVKRLLDGVDVPGVPRQPNAWKDVKCDPLHVFISYSHKDEQYMEQLKNALVPLVRTKEITVWADPLIEAGQEWRDEIFDNLDRADIFILLLSQASVASDFVTEKELPRAMAQRSDGPCEIMGVVVKPCSAGLQRMKLSDQQVIFYNKKAVSQTNQRDAAWDHVVKELERVIARIQKHQGKMDRHGAAES
jgi:internalin A